jgi:hypothetical protein
VGVWLGGLTGVVGELCCVEVAVDWVEVVFAGLLGAGGTTRLVARPDLCVLAAGFSGLGGTGSLDGRSMNHTTTANATARRPGSKGLTRLSGGATRAVR